jgi:aminoglycoside phosphotransferase
MTGRLAHRTVPIDRASGGTAPSMASPSPSDCMKEADDDLFARRFERRGTAVLLAQLERTCQAEEWLWTHFDAGLPAVIVTSEGTVRMNPGKTQIRGLRRMIAARYMDLCLVGMRVEASIVVHAHKEKLRLARARTGEHAWKHSKL